MDQTPKKTSKQKNLRFLAPLSYKKNFYKSTHGSIHIIPRLTCCVSQNEPCVQRKMGNKEKFGTTNTFWFWTKDSGQKTHKKKPRKSKFQINFKK